MNSSIVIHEGSGLGSKEGAPRAPGDKVGTHESGEPDYMAIMQARFPLSFGAISHEDAEEMRRVIEEECGRVDDLG